MRPRNKTRSIRTCARKTGRECKGSRREPTTMPAWLQVSEAIGGRERNPRSGRPGALHVLRLHAFFAGHGFKGHHFAFVQGFVTRAEDGRVMHKDVLSRIIGDEAKAFFVVEPLYFTT